MAIATLTRAILKSASLSSGLFCCYLLSGSLSAASSTATAAETATSSDSTGASANSAWDCQQQELDGKKQWSCAGNNQSSTTATAKEVTAKPVVKTNVKTKAKTKAKSVTTSSQSPEKITTSQTNSATQTQTPALLDHSTPADDVDHRNLAKQDWQPLPRNLTAMDERALSAYAQSHLYCAGIYVNPVNPYGNSPTALINGLAGEQNSLPIEASAVSTSMQDGIAIFDQKVLVTQGTTSLQADRASYAAATGQVELTGNVVVRSSDAAFGGSSASINMTEGNSVIRDANYIVHQQHIRGGADTIAADAQGNIQIENGSYTQCSPDSQFWVLEAGSIELDQQGGQGIARKATLKIEGLPVAYIPYARFPIGDSRQSGFLFPAISDSSGGLDLTVPYYFNLAPNLDATLAPRYNSKRGYITEAEGRWLNRFDEWTVSGAFIGNDSEFNPTVTAQNNNPDSRRWVLDIKERGQLAKRVFSRIDYTRVSDNDYLRDLNTTSLAVNRTTHLNQRASIDYIGDALSAGIKIQQYQSIDESSTASKPFEKTPELWLRYQSAATAFRLGANSQVRHSAFEHDSLAAGKRSYGELNVNYPMQWGGIRVAPSVGIQHLQYDLDKPANISTTNKDFKPSASAPQAQLKFDMVFEKSFGQPQAGKPSRRHTLEPGLLYLYRDADKQDDFPLFDTDRLTINRAQLTRSRAFGGYDRLENSNQASIYVTHRRFNSQGEERLAATIGQIRYFQDPDLLNGPVSSTTLNNSNQRINQSAIISDIEARFGRRWQTYASALWDPEDDQLDEGSISLRYRNQKARASIANLGYHYRLADKRQSLLQRDIEQADLSFVTAISHRWALIGRYQYDTTQARSNESLAGIEYNDCCVKWRVIYRDGLVYNGDGLQNQRDRSIFLQIELKGLFGIGNSVESVLDESISGYRALSGQYGSGQNRFGNNKSGNSSGTRHTTF